MIQYCREAAAKTRSRISHSIILQKHLGEFTIIGVRFIVGLRLFVIGFQVVYNILIVKMSSELPETGSAKLIRAHMFNQREDDVDVPDGDIQYGKKLYNQLCAGCHNYIGLGPSLISIYGSKAAQQRQFTKYSNKTISMRKHRWSKQRLFTMLQNPEAMFGVESAMTFDGLKDPYMRACIIEYIQFMRLTDPLAVKPKQYMKN